VIVAFSAANEYVGNVKAKAETSVRPDPALHQRPQLLVQLHEVERLGEVQIESGFTAFASKRGSSLAFGHGLSSGVVELVSECQT
jgi:hypothetical protein